jgi:hypothetical protein
VCGEYSLKYEICNNCWQIRIGGAKSVRKVVKQTGLADID